MVVSGVGQGVADDIIANGERMIDSTIAKFTFLKVGPVIQWLLKKLLKLIGIGRATEAI